MTSFLSDPVIFLGYHPLPLGHVEDANKSGNSVETESQIVFPHNPLQP